MTAIHTLLYVLTIPLRVAFLLWWVGLQVMAYIKPQGVPDERREAP